MTWDYVKQGYVKFGRGISSGPAHKRRWTNVGLMLSHRIRRWANNKTTLVQRLVFAGERAAEAVAGNLGSPGAESAGHRSPSPTRERQTALVKFRPNVADVDPAISQRWRKSHINYWVVLQRFSAHNKRSTYAGLMLVHRLRRWTNFKSTTSCANNS